MQVLPLKVISFPNHSENSCKTFDLVVKKTTKTNPMATIWKSKLSYSFSRNNDNLGENIYKILDEKIDNNPKETKMFLCEFIYKRRD